MGYEGSDSQRLQDEAEENKKKKQESEWRERQCRAFECIAEQLERIADTLMSQG